MARVGGVIQPRAAVRIGVFAQSASQGGDSGAAVGEFEREGRIVEFVLAGLGEEESEERLRHRGITAAFEEHGGGGARRGERAPHVPAFRRRAGRHPEGRAWPEAVSGFDVRCAGACPVADLSYRCHIIRRAGVALVAVFDRSVVDSGEVALLAREASGICLTDEPGAGRRRGGTDFHVLKSGSI